MNYTFLWKICLPAKLSAGDLNFFWVLASFFLLYTHFLVSLWVLASFFAVVNKK